MTNGQRSCALLLAALAAACDGPSAPTPAPASAVPDFSRLVTDERLQNAANEPDNWLTHGRTYLEQRHSPLTAINKDTLSRLAPAWHYEFDTSTHAAPRSTGTSSSSRRSTAGSSRSIAPRAGSSGAR